MSSEFLLHDGVFRLSNEPLILADSRAFRYGEGLFETIRSCRGNIPLWSLHWLRLKRSMLLLGIEAPVHWTEEYVYEQCQKILQKNKHAESGRIRLTVYKGEGGLWEQPSTPFHFIIQTWPLPNGSLRMNENGLDIGLFPKGRKSCDDFSSLKSNQYLLYVLAAQYARKQKWNDCLVFNQYDRVCDSTIANLFFLKDGILHTPALGEGCVDGVLRNYLIGKLKDAGWDILEGAYSPEDLERAEEVFLTNAIQGIKWVKSFRQTTYSCSRTAELFRDYIRPLFT